MLKIRLMRIGAKKRPFYRIVVTDERNKRNGAYIEVVGTYNPLTEPKEIKIKQDRVDHWLQLGAQKSDGLLRILKEAPQKPPRKPKKQQEPKAEKTPSKPQPTEQQPEQESEINDEQSSDVEKPPAEEASKEPETSKDVESKPA